PSAVIATLAPFGVSGPWADRPASEFTLQAMVGSTAARGVPGEEPVAVGGELGDFVLAAFSAPAILAATLAAQSRGHGAHLDFSQFEAMMHAFQTYRPIFAAFAPQLRPDALIEIPSIEPAADGLVGFCCITAQQWQDFCAMIGAPDWAEDESLTTFEGRMARRDELWRRIRTFTRRYKVDELVDLAVAFRIPVGPVGTGDVVAGLDHFAQRGVFVDNPHGFTQPRPPYQFSRSTLAPLRRAPRLGEAIDTPAATLRASLTGDVHKPLDGVRIVDLSSFWAGPIAVNLLRVLGAEVVKVESHVRLDGMRWASGLQREQRWEFSPVYHGANVGKTVVNLDLETEKGRAVLRELIASSDLVFENFSPRVVERWGFAWDDIVAIDPLVSLVRVPAFGLDGPWRDRVGFAMTMEQVSGLANRTGHVDGEPRDRGEQADPEQTAQGVQVGGG
ncbi:MAG: CoA transferase, partial [Acidobacteria bacterium]|nr:CoA transferase [Acidobacteriota bacterium]